MIAYLLWLAFLAALAAFGLWPEIQPWYRRRRQDRHDLHRVQHASDHWRTR